MVCQSNGWLPRKLNQSGIPFAIVEMHYAPTKFVTSALSLYRFLRSRPNAKIVHVHGRFPLFVSWLSSEMCPHLRFVVTVHQFLDAGSQGRLHWKSRLETLLLRRTKWICCPSADLQAEIVARVGTENSHFIDVIPNWIESLGHRKAQHSQRRRTLRICGVGRLSSEKGFDLLVQAVGLLNAQGYDVSCDHYGDGPERTSLLHMIRKMGLQEIVCLRGTHGNVRSLFPNYDALVIPSRTESFGMVALEAYDADLLVVASDVPGLRSTVLDGNTGLLFESDNSISLAKKLEAVICREVDVATLVANGRNLLRQYLPTPNLLNRYKSFYACALHHDGGPAFSCENVGQGR